MQKQIKVNDIYCLLKGSYDGAYEKLRYVDDIFTARNVRGNLLVWDLPGDGWTPLSNADSVMSAMVKAELSKRRQSVINSFGENNAAYLDKCFTVPDDGCIFFKTDSQTGIFKIRLTAWGYMTPVRNSGKELIGRSFGGEQQTNLHFSYGGEPLRNKQFSIVRPDGGSNIFTTDSNGNFNFMGQPLKIGDPIKIEVDGKQFSFTVDKDKTNYPIDLTQKASITVKVFLDGKPKQDVEISAATMQLLTDANGTAKFEVVIPQNGMLTVFVNGEYTKGSDTKAITADDENLFTFDFSSPKIEPPLTEPPLTEPSEEEKESPEQKDEPEQKNESDTKDEPKEDEKTPFNLDEPLVDKNPPITEDEPKNEDSDEKRPDKQSGTEISVAPQTQNVPEQSAERGSVWSIIFMIFGIVILIVSVYYVCYQILN